MKRYQSCSLIFSGTICSSGKSHPYPAQVWAAAKGFIELGLEPFHTVTILGHNHPSWHIR